MANLPINRTEAIMWLRKFEQGESDSAHYLESEAIMKALARKFGDDEIYWAMVGLLHDVDWAQTKDNWEEHCILAEDMLRGKGFDGEFVKIVQSHAYGLEEIPKLKNKERTKKIEHALVASETLTGIIHAYALMRGRMISDMEVKGLKKKFKDKSFAANCKRELIQEIEKTGLSLDEFFQIAINAIKEIKQDIGLI